MTDWPPELIERRARWLVDLAWADGDADRQKSWWPYCEAELAKLDAVVPGTKAGALDALKARREGAAA